MRTWSSFDCDAAAGAAATRSARNGIMSSLRIFDLRCELRASFRHQRRGDRIGHPHRFRTFISWMTVDGLGEFPDADVGVRGLGGRERLTTPQPEPVETPDHERTRSARLLDE